MLRQTVLFALVAALLPTAGAWGDAPKVLLKGWEAAFANDPKLFEAGVHPVDKPEKAFVVTGRLSREGVAAKDERDRTIAEKRAELTAKHELLKFVFDRDKGKLKLPPHLERLADDALKLDALGRCVTVKGQQTAAVWWDDKYVGFTFVLSQSGVQRADDFANQFRSAAGERFLQRFGSDKSAADLYRAFEADPDSKKVRAALADHFLARGHPVAAFLIHAPAARLPRPDDGLGRFLAGLKSPAWDQGLELFQADKSKVEAALEAFLRALDTRYVDPDTHNYAGACYRALGWPRLASVFFEQALTQSPGQRHRYALTSLGLCLLDLDRPDEARGYLLKAVEAYPDEPWTENARKALKQLDDAKKP